jgi:ATP-dependent RNA helicase RhlE
MDVDVVAKSLSKHGYDAAPIHGDLEQSQRMRTLDGFRDGTLRFLVASDVAARGLDIPNVSHVFNFDVPSHSEDYVHRIGRTGRAGRKGRAYTIAVPSDDKLIAGVEGLIQTQIPRLEMPTAFSAADDTAPAAPAAPAEKRSRRRKPANKAEAPQETSPVADAPAAEASAPPPAQSDTPPREEMPAKSPRPRKERGGRGRGLDRDTGPQQVGLVDHVPDFILRSFEERTAS